MHKLLIVVLDTNVIISRFITSEGIPARLIALWRAGMFEVLASPAILAEYRRALAYPKIRSRHKLDDEHIDQEIADIQELSILVDPLSVPRVITRDPSDDIFLACAVAGGADVIVSGDVHLLDLGAYQGIRILRPAAFLALLDEGTPP